MAFWGIAGLGMEFFSFWFAAPELLGTEGLKKLERGFEWSLRYTPWLAAALVNWLLYRIWHALAGRVPVEGMAMGILMSLLMTSGGVWVMIAVNRVVMGRERMDLDQAADAFGAAVDDLSTTQVWKFLDKIDEGVLMGILAVTVLWSFFGGRPLMTMLVVVFGPFFGLGLFYVGIAFLGIFVKALLNILADDAAIRRRAVVWGFALFGLSIVIGLFSPGGFLGKLGGVIDLAAYVLTAPELLHVKVASVQRKLLSAGVILFIVAALLQMSASSGWLARTGQIFKVVSFAISLPVTLGTLQDDSRIRAVLRPAAVMFVAGVIVQLVAVF